MLWRPLGCFGGQFGSQRTLLGAYGFPRSVFCRSQNGFRRFRKVSRTHGVGLAMSPSNLNSLWSSKCAQKSFKVSPKRDQNPFFLRLRFRDVVLLYSECIFFFFHRRTTLDLTAICSIFVGMQHFSRTLENHKQKHLKLTQNDFQKALREYEEGMKKSTREKEGKGERKKERKR